jgi:predicted DNA binding CopG/RHH family protein
VKLDREEKSILKSIERGEWRSVPNPEQEKARYGRYALATLRKDKRINIRISEQDLVLLQQRALDEGLPYQTLISSILHKYVSGRLRESARG